MKISKNLAIYSLAACLTVSPILVSADNVEKAEEVAPIKIDLISEKPEAVSQAEYMDYKGKIVEINRDDKYNAIFVKDKIEDPMNGEVYHISEDVLILDAKTKEFVEDKDLKEGMTVRAYIHKNTPVTLSIPGQSVPSLIVINESEDTGFIDLSKYDEELVNAENTLKITLMDDTLVVNESGEKVEEKDLKNRDLIVLYSISTKSIPAQAQAEKVILMDKKEELVENDAEEIKVLDKIVINEEIKLEKELYNNENGEAMIPLRQIAEALGYKVEWDNKTRTATLTKGPQWSKLTIGEDNYNFAKMIVKLGAAPELKDGTTFVPVMFLEEVLKVDMKITEAGMISIKK